MTYRLIIRGRAHTQLRDAFSWYLDIDVDLARRFLAEARSAMLAVSDRPDLGREWQGARRIALNRFPYAISYVVDHDAAVVRVIAIAHTRRRR